MKKHHKKDVEEKKEEKKEGIKEGIVKTVTAAIKENLEDYKESMVKNIESRVERDFGQRIEKLETKLEKEVEDFLLQKFDSMMEKFSDDIRSRTGGAAPGPEDAKGFSDLKENVKEIMDIQEELVSRIQQKGPVDTDLGRRLNELSSSVNMNGKEIKKLASQIEDIRNRPMPEAQAPADTGEIKGIEQRLLDMDSKLEQTRSELMERMEKTADRKSEAQPAPVVMEDSGGKAEEVEERLLSRIASLENDLYGMKKKSRRNTGAIILE